MTDSFKLALITGCSSGLGKALAEQGLDRGYHVVATARRPESITLEHPRLHKRALDLNDPEHIRTLCTQLHEEFGQIDLLINNAGFGLMGPMLEISPQKLAEQFQTNSIAPLELIQSARHSLKRGSTVVNIGSVSASLVTPFAGSYCASKAALHALSDAMRMELAPFGIRVMVVRAGAIRSKFAERAESELTPQQTQGPYQPLQQAIAERASLSQQNASDADDVAKRIFDASEQSRCPTYVGVANGHRRLYSLSKLPSRVTDWLLSRRFKLNTLHGDEL